MTPTAVFVHWNGGKNSAWVLSSPGKALARHSQVLVSTLSWKVVIRRWNWIIFLPSRQTSSSAGWDLLSSSFGWDPSRDFPFLHHGIPEKSHFFGVYCFNSSILKGSSPLSVHVCVLEHVWMHTWSFVLVYAEDRGWHQASQVLSELKSELAFIGWLCGTSQHAEDREISGLKGRLMYMT